MIMRVRMMHTTAIMLTMRTRRIMQIMVLMRAAGELPCRSYYLPFLRLALVY